ncbi:MAG TPA: AbrB/MazE/SpoVT family DNA-binding domain-containing protein [Candidatus Nanoarchaeia archaeon]|nr:AbrB/MazE/SpoVT family DNA-binding domain-containing protein [Candidatus Nanoarchaeia archaeon]
MITIETKLKGWGRSIGVIVPKEAVIKEHLKEGDKVELIILKKTNALRETFGKLKFKRTTDDILKEVDEESWDE